MAGPAPSGTHLEAALTYAAAEWPVFPLNGKDPFKGSHGFYDATTDPDQIRTWWTRTPRANIGTGIPVSLFAVDIDAKKGGLTTLKHFEDELGVPETLSVLTGGGGLHYYFLHPGGALRQGTDILGRGIDTRIPGKGYTILPPSLHESGRRYEWYNEDTPPAPAPRWMIQKLRPPRAIRRPPSRPAGNVDGRLAGILSIVTPDGDNWNDRLYWAARRVGELVRGDTLNKQLYGRGETRDPAQLAQLLLDAAGPWNEKESRGAMATIRSGMNKEGTVL